MKILIISKTFPYPPITGGKVLIYNSLKHISKHHDLTLVSFIESIEERRYIPFLRKYCSRVETVLFAPKVSFWDTLAYYSHHGLSVFSSTPRHISIYDCPVMRSKIVDLLNDHTFDVVEVDFTQMAQFADKKISQFCSVLVLHELSFISIYRRAIVTKDPLKRAFLHWEYLKMREYEKGLCSRFRKIVVLSELDRRRLKQLSPCANISVIPGSVDTSCFEHTASSTKDATILFVGSMGHFPNVDGIRYFHSHIFPLVKKSVHGVQLNIVGKDPPPEVLQLQCDKAANVLGYVQDLIPYYKSSSVFVCPIRIGGGIRMKILEAMAMGVPVVSTSIGCEGLLVENEKNIVVADEPQEFAEKVTQLLQSADYASKIGENGRRLVEKAYDSRVIAGKMMQVYLESRDEYQLIK